MALNSKIELTDEQKHEIAELVAENFGCQFQFAEYLGGQGWITVVWQAEVGSQFKMAHISPEGKVIRGI
jgi:hypothetical protein